MIEQNMGIQTLIRNGIRKLGYDISGYPRLSEATFRKKLFFESMEFDTVLDIGANKGQFAEYLRKQIKFKKTILSFEPLSSAFSVLSKKALKDPHWHAFNFALGDINSKKEINISGNSHSSSLLDMLPKHLDSAPDSKFIDKEWVEIKTLDSLKGKISELKGNVFLKIDTQGFEKQVLTGAKTSLEFINSIQLEVSLVPLYHGEPIFQEVHDLLTKLGYSLIDLEYGFCDPTTGQLLQIDGIFQRKIVPISG